jgi:hypothetical protein
VAQRFTAAFKCSKADLGGAAVYRCVQMQQSAVWVAQRFTAAFECSKVRFGVAKRFTAAIKCSNRDGFSR